MTSCLKSNVCTLTLSLSLSAQDHSIQSRWSEAGAHHSLCAPQPLLLDCAAHSRAPPKRALLSDAGAHTAAVLPLVLAHRHRARAAQLASRADKVRVLRFRAEQVCISCTRDRQCQFSLIFSRRATTRTHYNPVNHVYEGDPLARTDYRIRPGLKRRPVRSASPEGCPAATAGVLAGVCMLVIFPGLVGGRLAH